MLNMKLPLSAFVALTIGFIALATVIVTVMFDKMDAKFTEIGAVEFGGAELKSWKSGDCYVFGVAPTEETKKNGGHNHIQSPVFFSNCQK